MAEAGEDRELALEEEQVEIVGQEHGFRPEEVEDSLRLRDEIASELWNHYVQNMSTF